MNTKMYEVYVAYDKCSKPLYVGQGLTGRHKHCTSGVSHNKLLNKFYFTHGDDGMIVKVVHKNISREDSLQIEKDLIRKLNPEFNVVRHFPLAKEVDFNTDYVTLEILQEYRHQYTKYFESISKLSEGCLVQRVLEDAAIAEGIFNKGYLDHLIKMCGEDCLYTTPFFVKNNDSWVFNRAAHNLFDSTAKHISKLF